MPFYSPVCFFLYVIGGMPVCCLKKREKYHVELKPSVLPISETGMSLDLSRFFALVSRTAD